MTPLVLGLAMAQAVGLAADLRSTLALSDTSQATLRPALERPSGDAIDLETSPSVGLDFAWDKSNISLGYTPRLTLRDAFQTKDQLLWHGGFVGYSHRGPRYQFSLTEAGSYGEQSLLTLTFLAPPQASPTPQSSPQVNQLGQVQTVRVLSELTLAKLSYAWSRRWASTFSASYAISGGLEAADQRVLPRLRTASGGVSTDYAIKKHDTLGANFGLSRTMASNGYSYWLVSVSGGWKHKLTREMSSSVTAGLSFSASKDPLGVHDTNLYPVASAGLDGVWTLVRRRSYAVTVQVASSFAPVVNVYTGALQERGQAASTLGIAGKKSSLSGTVSAGQTFPVGAADWVGTIGFGIIATHSPWKALQIATGYRTAWQSANEAQVNSIPRWWMAFVAVTLYAPPVHF